MMNLMRFFKVRLDRQPCGRNSAQFPDTTVFQFRTKFHETEIVHKDSNFFFKVLLVVVPVFTRMNLKFLNQEVRFATLYEES